MLNACPAASPDALHAFKFASITLSMYVKSLDCLPSPLIVGVSPSSSCLMNFGITAA